jgi:choline dehydrogenase-like flavoprotein
MISHAEQLANDRAGTRDFDVCIIGAGPAGISLALELDGTGLQVCLLEAGGERYHRATQTLYEGACVGDHYPPLRDTRLGALGGSSNVWAGWCRPLEISDFEFPRGDGACRWPFSRDELMPYYRRAQHRCGLGVFEYDAAFWQARSQHAPLLADDGVVEHAMFHVLPQRFGARYRAQLEASENVQLVLRAPVERLLVAASGAVDGVAVRTLAGFRSRVKARRYVLAAGGIENARMLLLSTDSPDRVPGNAHGLVGRFFTDHPFVNIGTVVLDGGPRALDFYFPQEVVPSGVSRADGASVPAVRAALTLRHEVLATEQLPGAALFFHPRYESHPLFASAAVRAFLELSAKMRHKAVPGGFAPYLGRATRAPHHIAHAALRKLLMRDAPAERWRARAMFETRSRYENRVTLCTAKDALNRPLARVEWRLGDHELQGMRRVVQIFDESFRRAGVGRLEFALPASDRGWRDALEGGKHHIGTTRMHVDPRHGVVDPDCCVHGSDNLYITGSSVFPSGGYANPTLTIVALAIRLADHLRFVT